MSLRCFKSPQYRLQSPKLTRHIHHNMNNNIDSFNIQLCLSTKD
uniref:Uncharacterized protein n=1 Tax=Rhizophora mucronata TaxID=61149 RepID=A0A2P2PVU8_RHIMU